MKSKTRGWPPERRKRQAEIIRETKPWTKSTGPKTEEGKEKVKMNAYKHGWRGAKVREFEALLRAQNQFIKSLC